VSTMPQLLLLARGVNVTCFIAKTAGVINYIAKSWKCRTLHLHTRLLHHTA
jgi:hypothetical protein